MGPKTGEVAFSIPEETRKRVETDFQARMIRDGHKWGSKGYMTAQYHYFTGAMIALNAIPAYWAICLMSGREIIEKDQK